MNDISKALNQETIEFLIKKINTAFENSTKAFERNNTAQFILYKKQHEILCNKLEKEQEIAEKRIEAS